LETGGTVCGVSGAIAVVTLWAIIMIFGMKPFWAFTCEVNVNVPLRIF